MNAPLPELPFDAAVGDARIIYDSIADALGVQLVNLVYRHLATVPGCLEWAWATIAPDFRSGGLAAGAGRITAVLDAVADTEAGDAAPAVDLAAAGLSAGERAAVVETLDAYNRANPLNAIALQIVALALDAGRSAAPVALRPPRAELATLLPIVPLDAVDPATLAMLKQLARQATGGDTDIVPSLFRHFAPWPRLLEAISTWLDAAAAAHDVAALAAAVRAESVASAQDLFAARPPPQPERPGSLPPPGPALSETLGRTVRIFPPAICTMIVLGRLLRRTMTA